MSEGGDNRRQNYRILYPVAERPILRICRSTLRVIDLSEEGIRLGITGADRLVIAEEVTAGLHLVDGQLLFTGTLALLPNRRIQFALGGPTGHHPIPPGHIVAIRCWNTEYPVIGRNAEWIEFTGPDPALLACLPELIGQVEFSDEEVTSVRGRLLRVEMKSCVLHLSNRIAYQRIVAEQLRLRRKYRHIF